MEWVRARAPAGRVLALPSQTPGLKERLGLSRAEVDRAAWAITPDGGAYIGAAAVSMVLREMGATWRVTAVLYGLPGAGWLGERLYAWFARHRGRFARWGIVPACARPDVACTPEGE